MPLPEVSVVQAMVDRAEGSTSGRGADRRADGSVSSKQLEAYMGKVSCRAACLHGAASQTMASTDRCLFPGKACCHHACVLAIGLT